MPDLTTQIEQAAQEPEQVTVDGTSVRGVPLSDLIEADKYLAMKAAAKRGNLGLSFRKLIPNYPAP